MGIRENWWSSRVEASLLQGMCTRGIPGVVSPPPPSGSWACWFGCRWEEELSSWKVRGSPQLCGEPYNSSNKCEEGSGDACRA